MLEGVVLDDRFEIEEIAGRGGMATVYRARDRQTAELVAIKVLHVAGTSDVARFDREARVLDELDHPHIVRSITRGATPDGRVYLALEWLSGETLDQRLAHTLPTAAQALALAGRVASAAAHAHERGIVHRDIKPSNVFLVGPTFEDPRLLDFGVARVLRATRLVTRTGTALGTPAYMAPEQARGRRDVDARADVYALGCLLFECLSGRPPFEGDDVMAVLAKVLFDEPPRLANVVTNIAPALDELVASLMSREPAERPPNAGAVGRLLARVLPEVLREQEIVRGFSSGPPRPLTSREQKLVAIVAAAPPGREPGRGEDAATVEASAAIPSNEFGRVASEFGARFAALADGSCIAVIEAEGSATDLALRAARCALALRALRPSLPFAAVIGRTVSGTLPVGEVIDSVAALLRRAAAHDPPFEVQLDELTASLLEQRFEIAGQDGGHVLRGEREEPRAMRLLLGKPTPCVGRARELRALTQLYEDVARESEATFALVTGAAGMGKSRLLLELVARLGDAQPTPLVWVGRAEPMSAGSPFALAASIVRAAIGASRGERRETVEEKLRARVQARLRGREAERVVEFLAELLGVGLDDTNRGELLAARHDPMLMGDQIARAFEDWLDVEATANPAVIVLEDAHWGDAASVRVIESALRHAKQRPLYVVAVGRPEVAPDFAGLMSLRGAMLVNLGELSRKACAEFVDELLGATITPATREQIVEHAAGNAFFLEELVRFFAERRGESVATGPALPATVLAMLEARLAALPSHARRFVRAASIFGNAFWPAGVAALLGESATEPGTPSSSPSATRRTGPEPPSEPTPSGATRSTRAALDVLLAAEIVERRGVSRFPGIAELVFRHALVRDAAYAMLTDRDRASGHRLAADWLDAAGETESMVLAEHFERGGDGSRAALHLASAAKVALDGQDFASALELAARARKAWHRRSPHARLASSPSSRK
ncbi:MAG: protein kinase [Polyangiaceae bacterium]